MDTIKVRIEYTDDYAKANYTEERGHVKSEVMTIPLDQCTDDQREAIHALLVDIWDDPWGWQPHHYKIGTGILGKPGIMYGHNITFDHTPNQIEVLDLITSLYWEFRALKIELDLASTAPAGDLTPVSTPPTPTPNTPQTIYVLLWNSTPIKTPPYGERFGEWDFLCPCDTLGTAKAAADNHAHAIVDWFPPVNDGHLTFGSVTYEDFTGDIVSYSFKISKHKLKTMEDLG